MLPQELKARGTDKETILFEGIPHPVNCDKIRYYEDKRFTSALLPESDVPLRRIKEEHMASKRPLATSNAMGLAMAATPASVAAAGLSGTDQASRPAVNVPASTPASSMRDAGQIVSGFVDYIGALKDGSDVSIDRLQSAVGIQSRQGRSGIGYSIPASPEGDWITLRFSDGGKATGRSVILQFESDRDADESSIK